MGTWSGDMARAVSGRAHTGCPQPCPAHPALLHIPSRCGQDGGAAAQTANEQMPVSSRHASPLFIYMFICCAA